MNAELITALESAVTLLAAWEGRVVNTTVQYEVVMAKIHAQRAIDWEKSVGTEQSLASAIEQLLNTNRAPDVSKADLRAAIASATKEAE